MIRGLLHLLEGEDVYVYVLWEHQQRRYSLMALRMWIYMGMIYRHLANEGRQLPGVKLPFVFPIVLFQGTEGWKKGLVLEGLGRKSLRQFAN